MQVHFGNVPILAGLTAGKGRVGEAQRLLAQVHQKNVLPDLPNVPQIEDPILPAIEDPRTKIQVDLTPEN